MLKQEENGLLLSARADKKEVKTVRKVLDERVMFLCLPSLSIDCPPSTINCLPAAIDGVSLFYEWHAVARQGEEGSHFLNEGISQFLNKRALFLYSGSYDTTVIHVSS